VAVTSAIQQSWWDCFEERTRVEIVNTRDDGGVEGLIWSLDLPDARVSYCTFPSPEIKLRSAEAAERLKDCDAPCLMVTRIALDQWTLDAIERGYPPPVRFLQWTGSCKDWETLQSHIRALRESIG
jgi:hypothetical protein